MRELVARDVMNPDILKVRDDMTVAALAEFLVDHEISGAPVEDVEGRLIGVVSLTDVAEAMAGHDQVVGDRPQPSFYVHGWEDQANPEELAGLRVTESQLTAGEIMTPAIFAVDEELPVPMVADKMIRAHVHRLLVTRDQKVVGILTTSDLLGLLVDEPVEAER
jgi:CBS domain-containing protein